MTMSEFQYSQAWSFFGYPPCSVAFSNVNIPINFSIGHGKILYFS